MRFRTKAVLLGVVAVVCFVPVGASAHRVSQTDARGDAKGPFDLRSTWVEEDEKLQVLKVSVTEYNSIPRRPPGMPCVALDYKSGRGAARTACPAASGMSYELRETRTGRLIKRLDFTRPTKRSIRLAISARLLPGQGGIRWRAYIEGSGDTVADETRRRIHTFSN